MPTEANRKVVSEKGCASKAEDPGEAAAGDGAIEDASIIEMRENGTHVDPSVPKRSGPLKINGTFNDALRVLVGKKPKGPISTK